MRRSISLSLALAAGFAAAGCVSSKPVHYYTIEPKTPAVNAVNPNGPVLLVGSITTPESLQDGRIRYRIGPNSAGAYEYHRWTESPGEMVRNSLLGALRASGRYRRVLEAGSSETGDYLLRGKLYDFGEVDTTSIQTRVSLQVELVSRKANLDVWDHVAEHEEPVNGKKVEDVVQSLDRNLQRVVDETVAELDKFLATRQ